MTKILKKRKVSEFETLYVVRVTSEANAFLALFLVDESKDGQAVARKPRLICIKPIEEPILSPYASLCLGGEVSTEKSIALLKKDYEYSDEFNGRDYSYLSIHKTRGPNGGI